jgi:hypothetical protein
MTTPSNSETPTASTQGTGTKTRPHEWWGPCNTDGPEGVCSECHRIHLCELETSAWINYLRGKGHIFS